MIELEYCDLNIMSSNRILLKFYNNNILGKYIVRDFNDQILKIGGDFPECLLFGYIITGFRESYCEDDFSVWDFQVKKI
jgi:hypothetical protein